MKEDVLIKRKGLAQITLVKTKNKAVAKGVMKDKSLETSLAERRDITTSGKITRTTDLVPITRATRVMQTKVEKQREEMNEKLRMKTITLVT